MKLFIWDFHGVLEKGNDDAVVEITNQALEIHGYPHRMTKEESAFLSGRLWHEYFAFLIPGLQGEKYFALQSTCFEISQSLPEIIFKHIHLNDHADAVLNRIHNSPHCQILISNTLPESLEMFVNIVKIEKYFPPSHRFGVDTNCQKKNNKRNCLNEFLQDNNQFETIISIGDSPGDMALIDHSINTKGIGYLYSHPGREHRQAKCNYKINDLRLVLQEISDESTTHLEHCKLIKNHI